MNEVRIIIAGSREFNDYDFLKEKVNDVIFKLECKNAEIGIRNSNYTSERNKIKIVSGTARGADQLGEKFAAEYGYGCYRFPADWDGLGKRAGYIRNAKMAEFAISDGSYGVLIAFWNGESRGTKHMIDLAKKHKLDVYVITV